ncbi:MAG: cell wall metabolism sensor histidine kinase WalK [Firmicutes bacterium]|nr:cell wall metabolism sensor histidine kinase WalK [Bacillota bacterium]
MFKSIRTKLTATYIIIIVAVMVLTSFLLLNILKQYYFDYQYTDMTRSATLISSFVAPKLIDKPDAADISKVAFDFARQINARVIVTDHKQRVVGDSQRVEGLVGTTLDRKEIEAALAQKQKWTVQYSEISDNWVLQVAVPVLNEDKVVGVVFLASSLSYIHGVQHDIRNYLIIATVLSIIIAGLLGRFLARRMTDPLQALTAAAEKMARGDFSQQVTVSTRDEIGRLTVQFNEMAQQLQQSTKQLKEFVANASHEMRSPLTSLNILVKSLRDYPLDKEEQQEFLADIDEELERLIRLVEDLLDLTRLDSVASDDTMALLDIVPAVRGTLEMLRKRAEEKELIFSYTLPERTTPILVVLHQIKQIVFNLVDNAFKYTPAGGQVKVTLSEETDCLKLCVIDTGVGIPADQREKVFERFYRVDKARSREQGGTGLGLSIVREIVKRHGGKVWVEEGEQGRGSVFIVTLPLPEIN